MTINFPKTKESYLKIYPWKILFYTEIYEKRIYNFLYFEV